MVQSGVEPNIYTYSALMEGYCLAEAMNVFHTLENGNFELSVEIINCLFDGLCKRGKLDIAWDLFYNRLSSKGLKPTVVTYNVMIHGLCKEAPTGQGK
ncbi:hypothetical protein JCGZ_21821 [Jatropha curcas]|uniref:Pentatricopeptide repeat-containing protein n=1 Tax=Jatropha curcas TaxID=180498 RepID=A0A067JMW0_JATCU|nr:hypothetical protein JCGZ_21821 [Jatropha curcas]